jgi:hypothetical protein
MYKNRLYLIFYMNIYKNWLYGKKYDYFAHWGQ